jgi:2-amino-4-hydroxy-6-hydroxymethyldihydropteridine diphosphokinase
MNLAPEKVQTARVYLGLGSNISPEENLSLGVRELRWHYGPLDLSLVYRSRAVGFAGDDFLNMVVGLNTAESISEIREQIDRIHELAGRERGAGRFTSRPLDIDMLLYDDEILRGPRYTLPRPDILRYGFVLRPLAELAPNLVHPETGRTMCEHWRELAAGAQPMTVVPVAF